MCTAVCKTKAPAQKKRRGTPSRQYPYSWQLALNTKHDRIRAQQGASMACD